MVELPRSMDGGGSPASASPVKLEVADTEEEQYEQARKRSRLDGGALPRQDMHCNVFDEPSPLGLQLRKSPSLLDLIQRKLLQEYSSSSLCVADHGSSMRSKKKEAKSSAAVGASERLKASNFSALVLKIGSWEFAAKNDGELVAKCYFAKHKLVWEVLEGGLKSKIEIQWSDICAITATCPEDGIGTMDVVLSRPPLFYKETDPQPRKHTLWQATSDFTGGQASIHRRHFLQCHTGLLSKNFEKLVQCDDRLLQLSRRPAMILESPFFEARSSVFKEQVEPKRPHVFERLKDDPGTTFSGLINPSSPMLSENRSGGSVVRASEGVQHSADSGVTFIPTHSIGEQVKAGDVQAFQDNLKMISQDFKHSNWLGQLTVPALRPSMSVDDLVNHWENCISEQQTLRNQSFPTDDVPTKAMLEGVAQYLLSDTLVASTSDEKSVMSRVNSLCCLIQKDMQPPHGAQPANSDSLGANDSSDESSDEFDSVERMPAEAAAATAAHPIPRKDSFGDLLMGLPHIASLPRLFGIPEHPDK